MLVTDHAVRAAMYQVYITETHVSSQPHYARHTIPHHLMAQFSVPVDTFLYRKKTNTFVKKENNTCNPENNLLLYNTTHKEVPHINRTHVTFFF